MPQVQKETVFYVEDEPVNVMLMRLLFGRRPRLELEVASSLEEAERLASDLHPSLLLLDLRLPDGHGTELLQRLRKRPGWERIPAVAVTAESHFDTHGTGFAEVWRKPLNTTRVLERLDTLLGTAAEPPSSLPAAAEAEHGQRRYAGSL